MIAQTPLKCFMLEETGKASESLRRYTNRDKECTGRFGYHNADNRIGEVDEVRGASGCIESYTPKLTFDKADSRWPAHCECGYAFQDGDEWQIFHKSLYRRMDTGEIVTLETAPAGALWNAWWLADSCSGPDGRHLTVRLPDGGEWSVDGPASNCTMPDDRGQKKHHCWVRTGEPPNITVGKEGGPTCEAGGGSILTEQWHGFLTRGWLHTDRNVPA